MSTPNKLSVYRNTTVVTQRTDVLTYAVTPDLFAFKRYAQSASSKQSGNMRTQNPAPDQIAQHGFISATELDKMVNGHPWSADTRMSVLKADGREILRQHGLSLPDHLRADVDAARVKDVVKAFVHGEVTVNDVVCNDPHAPGDPMTFLDGSLLPVAVDFDYESGARISNITYDLEKLAVHLLSRDDVHVFMRDPFSTSDLIDTRTRACTVAQAITPIPYFDRTDGRTTHIAFRWAPSQEDYQMVWDTKRAFQAAENRSMSLHEAIWATDVLGLRSCGAALMSTAEEYDRSIRSSIGDMTL